MSGPSNHFFLPTPGSEKVASGTWEKRMEKYLHGRTWMTISSVCHQPELAKGSHILLWVRKPTFFSFLFIVLVFGFLT
jgi:hypothetical protein